MSQPNPDDFFGAAASTAERGDAPPKRAERSTNADDYFGPVITPPPPEPSMLVSAWSAIKSGASSLADAASASRVDPNRREPGKRRGGTRSEAPRPYGAGDERIVPTVYPEAKQDDSVLNRPYMREGAAASDPMLRQDYVDSQREEYRNIPESARLGLLTEDAKRTDAVGRAAKVILGQVQQENARAQDALQRKPMLADAVSKAEPLADQIIGNNTYVPPPPPPGVVQMPDLRPSFGDLVKNPAMSLDDASPQRLATASRDQALGRAVAAASNGADSLADRATLDDRVQRNSRKDFAEANPHLGAAAAGAAGMLAGGLNAPAVAAQYLNELLVDPFLNAAGIKRPRVANMPGADYFAEMAKQYMPKVASQEPDKAWRNDQFVPWLTTNLAAQAPQFAGTFAALLSPALRALILPAMGAQTAGKQYQEGDSGWASVSKGIIEGGSELLPFHVFDKAKSMILALPTAARGAVFAETAKRLAAAGAAVTAQKLADGLSETASAVGQNLVDRAAGKDTPLLKGAASSFILGAAMGGVMGLPNAARALKGNETHQEIAATIDERADLWGKFFAGRAIEPDASGVTKPQSPVQDRSDAIKRFDELAAAFGLDPEAAKAVKGRAESVPAADAPGWLARVTRALNERGLFAKPVDDAGVGALDIAVNGPVRVAKQPPPEEEPAGAAPGAPATPAGPTPNIPNAPLGEDAISGGAADDAKPHLPTDLVTGDGYPYGTASGAQARANKDGGVVTPVAGGWVVRPAVSPKNTGETDGQPDLAGAAAVPAGPGAGRAPDAGGSGPAVGSPADGAGGLGPAAGAADGRGGPAAATRDGLPPNQTLSDALSDALSDTPDFKASWPNPLMGSDSAFDGLDGEHLVSAVVGTHRDAIRDVVINAKMARALRDGLEQGFDPATGQPATPERETAMRTELASTHDAITGMLDAYGAQFGDKHRQAFQAHVVGDLADLTASAPTAPAAPAAQTAPGEPAKTLTPRQQRLADAARELGDALGIPADTSQADTSQPAGDVPKGATNGNQRQGQEGLLSPEAGGATPASTTTPTTTPATTPASTLTSATPTLTKVTPAPWAGSEFAPRIDKMLADLDGAGTESATGMANAIRSGLKFDLASGPLKEEGISFREGKARETLAAVQAKPTTWTPMTADRLAAQDRTTTKLPEPIVQAALAKLNALGPKLAALGHQADTEVNAASSPEARAIADQMREVVGALLHLAPARYRAAKGYKNHKPEKLSSFEDHATQVLGIDTRAHPGVDMSEVITSGGVRERIERAAKNVSTHPKTVWGSTLLGEINRQLGGLSLALLHDLSYQKELALKDRNGRPLTGWHNPSGGKGVGALFREGGLGDTNELAEWMESEGYIAKGSFEEDYKAADEEARRLVTAALNREPTLTMDQQLAQAEDYQKAEEEAYYKALDAAAAVDAEVLRRNIMGENDITAAEISSVDDSVFDPIEQFWPQNVTQDQLLRMFGWSDEEIQDAIKQDREFADANEAARPKDAAVQFGQEARGDGPARARATAAPGAAAPRPAGDGDQAQALAQHTQHDAAVDYVDRAAASMTDAQVMAVAQILGIDGRRSVPMQRTLIVTRDSLAARAAIEQVLAQAPSTPDAAPDFELNAQTSEELRARAASNAAADKNDADEQRRLDAKARADAGVGDFVLTGSDRAADVGAANGQQDIFAAPPAAAPAAPQIDLSDAQAFANDYAAFVGRDVAQSVPLDRNTQAVLRMDAAQALRELDARASALDALKLCIGGRA